MNPTARYRRGIGRSITLGLLWVLLGVPAAAQPTEAELQVAVRESAFARDGSSTITVNVTGSATRDLLEPHAFSVTENGEPMDELAVRALVDEGEPAITAMLAIDTSSSMSGAPLNAIREAAASLIDTLVADDIPVGLLRFDQAPQVMSEPTTDGETLIALLETMDTRLGTALYDGVAAGVERLRGLDGVPSLIVLADGSDNGSVITLERAISLATDAGVAITVIALETPQFDLEGLRPLADETGGQYVAAADVASYENVFASVADDVASQYRIGYESGQTEPVELEIEVTVVAGNRSASSSFVVANQRSLAAAQIAPESATTFDAGWFGTRTAMYAALALAFLAVMLLFTGLLLPWGDAQASRALRRTLAPTDPRTGFTPPTTAWSVSAIGHRALDVIESAPKPSGYEERVQVELDRAGWQLRANELLAARLGVGFAALVVSWALTGAWWLGVLAGTAGIFAPNAVLLRARRKRLQTFLEQLPDTLQLLSGTLRAGYGLLQGIDTIVKETDGPMAAEFQRVLTEARLGLPLEESLHAMADRVDSGDFRWVVVAMNIQRQVGGNLADLLETVSETLRGREQTRRQIQVLSAEGRLSATILVALPFVLLLYLLLTNPVYLAPLVTTAVGIAASLGALLLLAGGIAWMIRMIRIDV